MSPERKSRLEKLRRKLVKIAGAEGNLESLARPATEAAPADTDGSEEGLEAIFTPTPQSNRRSGDALRKMRDGDFDAMSPGEEMKLEAIVEREGRPVAFINNGTYQILDALWTDYNDGAIHQRLRKVIPAIGRVERFSPSGMSVDHVGTGFIVGKGLMMTNRHVAELFVTGAGAANLVFRSGGGFHFGREHGSNLRDPANALHVTGVKMVHPYWDMALLEVTGLDSTLGPLELSVEHPDNLLGRRIATIGYPGRGKDFSAEAQELERQFYEGIYGVKRIAPGEIDGRRSTLSFGHQVPAMIHDSSTLAGNSGSAIVDVGTGQIIGLHFKGKTLDTNYSVPIHELARDRRVVDAGVNFLGTIPEGGNDWEGFWKDGAVEGAGASGNKTVVSGATLKRDVGSTGSASSLVASSSSGAASSVSAGVSVQARGGSDSAVTLTVPLTISISLGGGAGAGASAVALRAPGVAGLEAAEDYSDREGYDKDFLGAGLRVPLPKVSRDADKVLRFGEDEETELKYHHFSVVMHEPRRMCIFSAVNIDGKLSTKKPRKGWRMDSRIPDEAQIMKECYGDPPKFSRGHMTRREDPVWGDSDIAATANADSMHVTNAVPQMQPFNAPIWLGLEDYALDHAREDDMRISVFTGPVFDDDDPVYYGVKVPVTFWKIIAFIHDETEKLCATGYTMEQGEQLPQEGLEFVFGQYKQTQVSLKHIEELTGLKFGAKLLGADPLRGGDGTESAAEVALADPGQIRWV